MKFHLKPFISRNTSLTRSYSDKTKFSKAQKEFVNGSLLAGSPLKPTDSKNPSYRFVFQRPISDKEYVMKMYELMKDFTRSEPTLVTNKKKDNTASESIRFTTLSHPLFSELYDIFYETKESGNGHRKTVPGNIQSLLNEPGLGHLFSQNCHYVKSKGIYVFPTYRFTYEEQELIRDMLIHRFGVKCTIQKKGKYFMISVSRTSVDTLSKLVEPHIHESFKHKLIQNNKKD